MQILRQCPFTGEINAMEIPKLTIEMLMAWASGELIQNAMPELTLDEREFIMTGITSDVWDKTFNKEEI